MGAVAADPVRRTAGATVRRGTAAMAVGLDPLRDHRTCHYQQARDREDRNARAPHHRNVSGKNRKHPGRPEHLRPPVQLWLRDHLWHRRAQRPFQEYFRSAGAAQELHDGRRFPAAHVLAERSGWQARKSSAVASIELQWLQWLIESFYRTR